MPIITGGVIIPPSTTNLGVKGRIYRTNGVPTDTTIGMAASNGLIAEDVTNGNIYERQAGAWVRIDTL